MALSYTLEISEAKLQNKVSEMMPLKKNKFYFTVTLSEPEIELFEGSNEIGIFTHIELVGPREVRGYGRAKITGSLSYHAEAGAFFFKNPKIVQLEIDKVSEKYVPHVKAIVQLVSSKMLEKRPVYRLKDNNLKHKFAKAMLQSVSVKDKKLLLELRVL